MQFSPISDQEFGQFQQLLREIAGIYMAPAKKALLTGRLGKRLQHGGFRTYGEYFRHLTSLAGKDELRIAVDLLTTNETYFFREQKHFEFLAQKILPARKPGAAFRVWSAACSSGEEPYSIAMTLANAMGDIGAWELLASDISTRILDRARSGHYALERAEKIPPSYLKTYCLKGAGPQDGTFLISRKLRDKVKFMQVNLNATMPNLGEFDVIFLRNVMIYFEMETKRQVLSRLLPLLKPGGYFFISHSESLNGVTNDLEAVTPSIYRKP